MKHRFKPSLVLAVKVFATVMLVASAKAQVDLSDLTLFNLGSNLCVQPVPESALNGALIKQQTCNRSRSQKWTLRVWQKKGEFIPTEYLIMNSQTGLCLDNTNGNSADRTPVQQWNCNFSKAPSTTSLWTVVRPRSLPRYYVITNVRTGKCLDVRAGSGAPGAVIQM